MDTLPYPLSKDIRSFSSIPPILPPKLPAASSVAAVAAAAFEQRSVSSTSSPYSGYFYQDSPRSETTTNMGVGNSPSPREQQQQYSSDRWQQARSESGSGYHSPYTASYPHTPSGLRPAEPGQFSAEPWSSRAESSASAQRAAVAGIPTAGPSGEVGPGQQPPLLRPIKRPSSPDYWATQPASRQRQFVAPNTGWTGQVAVPQPGQLLQNDNIRCKLVVRQQPEVARACGFGERDRRAVDPPPVVELEAIRGDGAMLNVEELHLAHFVVQASLWREDGAEDLTTFLQPPRIAARRLLGSLAASPAVAADEHNKKGAYFTFADLSCREAGRFRLKFTLASINPSNRTPGNGMPLLANVYSDIFTVYSPRDFPGMRRSTPLTQALKIQGVAIPARKGRNYPMPRQGEEGPAMQD